MHVVWLALGMVIGLALAPAWAPRLAVCSAGFVLGLLALRVRREAAMLCGLALGGMLGRSLPEGPVLRGPVSVQGRVAAAPVGRVGDVSVWACASDGLPFRPCRGRVRVVFASPPEPGSNWVVRGEASAVSDVGPSGGPSRVKSARLARVHSVVRARSAVRLGPDRVEAPVVEGPRAVLVAVATGDRRGVDDATWTLLRNTGTSHLLAISGFHVGVVAGGVGGVFAVACRRLGVLRREGVSSVWAWWVGAAAGGVYAALAGAPISAQRAAGVVVLAAVGRSLGRELDPLRLVAIAAVGVCVVDPAALATPGFQLSFGAVLGLIRFGPMLEPLVFLLPRGTRWAGQGLSATIGATLGTLPAACWWFQSLSITSPLANMFAVPFMAVAIVPCAAGSTWLPEPLAEWSAVGGEWAVRALLFGLNLLSIPPLNPAVGPIGAVLLCAIALRVRVGWIGSVLLLVLGLRTRAAGGLEVTFFDVGQGDAALVEHPDGQRWLVDGGRRGIAAALRRRGVRTLDRVIVSHADTDHSGGLIEVVRTLRVRSLWVSRLAGHEALLGAAVARGVDVHIVERTVPASASDNDASLVVRAESAWGSVLFAGDVEALGEAEITAPATVLKVPHHGSKTSSSPGLLDRVQPALAVMSVGFNRFGHPHFEVTERYAQRGIPVLRTDLDGTITVRMDPQGVRAYSETGPVIWLDGSRRATTPKTTMANTASTMLIPWL